MTRPSRPKWSAVDKAKLAQMWPRVTEQHMVAVLNRRWAGIKAMACRLGLERKVRFIGKRKKVTGLLADISAARIAANMSLKELAAIVGCAEGTMTRFESSGRSATLFQLTAICDALGLQLRAVRVGKPRRVKPTATVVKFGLAKQMMTDAKADMKRWRKLNGDPRRVA